MREDRARPLRRGAETVGAGNTTQRVGEDAHMGVVAFFVRVFAELVEAVVRLVVRCYRALVVAPINRANARRGMPPLSRGARVALAAAVWGTVAMIALAWSSVTALGATTGTVPPAAYTPSTSAPRTTVTRPPMPPIPTITRVWTPTPEPTPEPAPVSEAPTGGSNVHVDVDRPHHNLPDGALTGGFCRHHRWC